MASTCDSSVTYDGSERADIERLLVQVWREACQHIELEEAVVSVARVVRRHVPLGRLVLYRFDSDPSRVTAFDALANTDGGATVRPARVRDGDARPLASWARSAARSRDLLTELPPALVRDLDLEGVRAVPLCSPSGLVGLLVLAASDNATFSATFDDLAGELREPFEVAIDNDHRMQELASLRAAAEADRGSLLRRLGREGLDERIVGEEGGLAGVMRRVSLVATSDAPVLLLGETGTGKEVVGRAIHHRSARAEGPFIRVNCGAIPPELVDSQLFGHERGAFTGATETRQGWFERADGGTLFLDEIGELPHDAQVRFLRVLQDSLVERVGGATPLKVDVRIVAATHRDLASMVQEGRFREDLWYRIAVFPVMLPPLRERLSDLPALAMHFAERASKRFGLPLVALTEHDVELLASYRWPGNIRELAAVIDRAAILGEGRTLEVSAALGFTPQVLTDATVGDPGDDEMSPILTLDGAMKRHIERALRRTKGQIEGRTGAAALLGINPHTLRARMRKLGVAWASFR
jgi:transcriptional regulator with GAF, ATPase, and Fis domain